MSAGKSGRMPERSLHTTEKPVDFGPKSLLDFETIQCYMHYSSMRNMPAGPIGGQGFLETGLVAGGSRDECH